MVGKALKWLGIGAGALVALVLVVWLGASLVVSRMRNRTFDVPATAPRGAAGRALLTRGRHLTNHLMMCADCHGPDMGGKVVIANPLFGTIAGSNITSPRLKDWSDGEVARAIRHGIGRNGRPLLLMPSIEYSRNLSEADLAAIVAYVKTLPAVDRPSVPSRIGPLLEIMIALGRVPGAIGALKIDHAAPYPPAVPEGLTVAYGRYLASNTCGGCHRPDLTGGPIPGAPPDWPAASDITQRALGGWSEQDFLDAMRTGVNPSGRAWEDPMLNITVYARDFTPLELKAIWLYLKTVKGKTAG